MFGRIPSSSEPRRPFFLAFVVFNIIALPLMGNLGLQLLPVDVTGAPPPAYEATASSVGEGNYFAVDPEIVYDESIELLEVSAKEASGGAFFQFINRLFGDDVENFQYALFSQPGSSSVLHFNGQQVEFEYSSGPDYGIMLIEVDGSSYLDADDEPYTIDAYSAKPRYGILSATITVDTPGEHTLKIVNSGEKNPESSRHRKNSMRYSISILPIIVPPLFPAIWHSRFPVLPRGCFRYARSIWYYAVCYRAFRYQR